MKKYIESRLLGTSTVRSLCIKNNWYTCGSNEQYDAMFAKLYNEDGTYAHITTEKLAEIATDIYYHSEIDDYTVDAIMDELARNCTYIFEKE